jgi:hypothetical protein
MKMRSACCGSKSIPFLHPKQELPLASLQPDVHLRGIRGPPVLDGIAEQILKDLVKLPGVPIIIKPSDPYRKLRVPQEFR